MVPDWTPTLAKSAHRLNLRNRRARALPALWLVTDERRLADPLPAAAALPRGAGVLFRHYGHPDRTAIAGRLAQLCRRRGLVLLIADDAGLARRVHAAGIHLPEARLFRETAPVRKPGRIATAAVHGLRGIAAARRLGIDAVFLAPVYPTASHPGRAALGPRGFARLVRRAGLPVYALGGITPVRALALAGSGAAGLAAIGALQPTTKRVST